MRHDMVEVLEKRARRLKEFMRVAPGRLRHTTTNIRLMIPTPWGWGGGDQIVVENE